MNNIIVLNDPLDLETLGTLHAARRADPRVTICGRPTKDMTIVDPTDPTCAKCLELLSQRG